MAGPVEAGLRDAGLSPAAPSLDELLPALQRLDRLLERAMASAPTAYGPEAAADPYRGLYISQEEVARLLAHKPGVPTLWVGEEDPGAPLPDLPTEASWLAWMERTFVLSPFDVDLILIALASELDLRYERLYAYLQDDVTRRRPSVDLALNLLCPSAEAKLARRAHFAPDAPLIRHGLLYLIPDPSQVQPPLLAHFLKLDEQIIRLLLGQDGLDPRLAPFCQMMPPTVDCEELPLNAETKQALWTLACQARDGHQPLRLYFYGPSGVDRRRTAQALACEVAGRFLNADLARALATDTDFGQVLPILFREARFQDAILYLDGADTLQGNERALSYQQLVTALGEHPGIVILAGALPWRPARAHAGSGPLGVFFVPFPIPDFAQRRRCWQANLAATGMTLDADDLDALTGRFLLTSDQIAEAVEAGRNQTLWRTAARSADELSCPTGGSPTLQELFTAARAQSGLILATLARKIEPRYRWNDIVLPPDQTDQLREICLQVQYRHIVYGDWGFDRKLSLGKGLNVLFSGPPGTGKTMAAEVIANQLNLDLYKIDLSQVVSKYIGETEKNLHHVFQEAQGSCAILFFDEADALFGKRSEVKDAHDRYANIEIAYLLQKMEEYEGIVILATNLRQHLDEAFVRRMHVIVEFPFPDEEYRRRIWDVVLPPEAPRGEEVDFGVLAREVRLAGGNIKNIALAAAFYAAAEGCAITMPHLMRATRREFQKMGRDYEGPGLTA